jgi:hypothetical protein
MALKLVLAEFCGFIFAITLVNLFPGKMVRGGNSKLQRLVHGAFPLPPRSDWVLTHLVSEETLVFQPIPMFEKAPTEDSDTAWEALLGRE